MRTIVLGFALASAMPVAAVTPVEPATKPPALAPQPVTETYFGTAVTDRFRQVEALGPATLDWMRANGAHTRAVLDSIAPLAGYRTAISERSGAFGTVKSVQRAGDRLFYLERAPGRDQFDLMVREADGSKRRLIDMAALIAASDKVPHAIDYFAASHDGKRVAVGISSSGSEDSQLSIVDATTGKTLGGPLDRARLANVAWLEDGSGLFFTREHTRVPGAPLTDPYSNATVNFWTGQGEPLIVVGAEQKLGPNRDPVGIPVVGVVPGSSEALLIVATGVQNEVQGWVATLADARVGRAKWRQVITTADAVTKVSADSSRVYLLSHRDAPTFKVTAMRWTGTAANATTLLAGKPGRINESLAAASDGLYVGGREGLSARPLRIAAGGKVEAIVLPYTATMGDITADPDRPGAIFDLDAFTRPPTTYAYTAGKLVDLGLESRPRFDYTKYRAVEMTATARDGTEVPLTVLTLAGPVRPRPTLLDAYGAYGISALPYFSPRFLTFVDAGGSIAECNVRGGGELGDAWRLGGKDANKPNTWRDAIACAEALVKSGFTTPAQLAITGTSAGGIMVGRAVTERPDLFAAAITRVGDSNALRSETMVSGPANIPEFGTVKDPAGFKNLYEMDAYQHIKDGVKYPAWMLTTGLTDPRVAPWQAGKMAARLQEAGGPAPVLLRIEEQAGHGMGTTRSTRDAEEADIAAFVFWRAGVAEWQPKN